MCNKKEPNKIMKTCTTLMKLVKSGDWKPPAQFNHYYDLGTPMKTTWHLTLFKYILMSLCSLSSVYKNSHILCILVFETGSKFNKNRARKLLCLCLPRCLLLSKQHSYVSCLEDLCILRWGLEIVSVSTQIKLIPCSAAGFSVYSPIKALESYHSLIIYKSMFPSLCASVGKNQSALSCFLGRLISKWEITYRTGFKKKLSLLQWRFK